MNFIKNTEKRQKKEKKLQKNKPPPYIRGRQKVDISLLLKDALH